MIRKTIKVVFVFLFASLAGNSQNSFENYQPMRSIGDVPEDFKVFFEERSSKALEEVTKGNRKEKRLESNFHLENQYFMDRTLNSGNVLFGDDVTLYLQKVLDKVLELYGETDKKIRVYTVRSPVFNAAATHEGVLLVNLGLMAQIENEAQLAFILAHEIIHSEEDHVLEGFKERVRIKAGDNILNSRDEDKLVAMSTYSQSLEFEADLEAFNRVFSKSGYDYREVLRVMDVMLYSYLPFDELPFPVDFFNSGAMTLEPSYFPTAVNPITAVEDFEDSLATHPNLRERKNALTNEFKNLAQTPTNKLFLVDEEGFFHAQTMARFELCRVYLSRRQYADAIYNSFILLQSYPNNEYLRQIIGSALYSMAVYKNMNYKSFLPDVASVEGNKMSVVSFLDVVPEIEMNLLATRYNYELQKAFPNNEEAKKLFDLSIKELVYFNEIEDGFFESELPEEKDPEVADSTAEETQQAVGRRGRSRKVTALKQKATEKVAFSKYALADLLTGDSVFTERLNQEIKTYQKEKQEKGFVSVKDKRTPSNKEQELSLIEKKKLAKKTEDRRTEKNPPVEKVVVLAPGAYSGSTKIVMVTNRTYRLDFVLDLEKTGKEQKKTRDILESALEKSNLEYEWLDLKKVDGADEFNDYVNLQAWLNEFWIHPTEDNRVTEMPNIQGFIEKYKTPYVLLTAQEITHTKPDLSVMIFYTVFFVINPYPYPLLMSNELKSRSFTNHMVLINLENGTVRTVRKDEDLPYSKHVRANLLYGHLLDLKTAPQETK